MTISRFNSSCKSLALTVLVSLAALSHAAAHAFIDHTDPAVGGTVRQSPAEVRLWFTEGLEAGFSSLRVFDAAGKQVDKKDARVDPKNPRQFTVSLPGSLGAGTYKVVWRVVATDTHVTQGDFTFRVDPSP